MRVEKHAMDDSASQGPAHKKLKEKMPDFDWAANNYALTWRLVEELRRPENKTILFPEIEGVKGPSGETKEDVYRRIAKVVHPEAYAQDPQITSSRMKNKNVSTWKEYSTFARRLQELCALHQVVLPAEGPDESMPADIRDTWRSAIVSMPVFPLLRTFMPIRPEERPREHRLSKLPSQRDRSTTVAVVQHHQHNHHAVAPPASVAPAAPPPTTPGPFAHNPITDRHEDEILVDSTLDPPPATNTSVMSYKTNSTIHSSPIPDKHRASGSSASHPDAGGRYSVTPNQHGQPHTSLSTYQRYSIVTLHDYLELRRSYQEDVRLGIFTPAEAKQRIEALDRHRAALESAHGLGRHNPYGSPRNSRPSVPLDPMSESVYEEKVLELGFRKPITQHPVSRLSFKDFFKAILEHAGDCDLAECRLDNKRKLPRLGFLQPTNPQELGMLVEVAIATRHGLVPLVHHLPAACARFISRNSISVMDVPLIFHGSSGWETTIWDHAHAIFAAALRRPLTGDEIKSVQAQVQAHHIGGPIDNNFRQHVQMLNDGSPLFDLLRLGLLLGNAWEPASHSMIMAADESVNAQR